MSFLTPLTAGIAALITIPLLTLLYFLKLRRRKVSVPSTLLWQKAFEDLEVNTPFQKLRNNLLLWLQLLLLLALLIAFARPVTKDQVPDDQRLAIILDCSASMNTQDMDGQTRLEAAKKWAKDLIRQNAGKPTTVIRFASEAQVLADFTTDRAQLINAINQASVSDLSTDLNAALSLLEPEANRLAALADNTTDNTQSKLAVYVLTDGRIDSESSSIHTSNSSSNSSSNNLGLSQDAPRLPGAAIVYQAFAGKQAERQNLGVTAFAARRDFKEPQRVDVYARVAHAGPTPIQTTATLTLDGEKIKIFPIDLPASQEPTQQAIEDSSGHTQVIPPLPSQAIQASFFHTGSGLLRLQIDQKDVLPADDQARLVLAPAQPKSVLLVTERPGANPIEVAMHACGVKQIKTVDATGYRLAWRKGLKRNQWLEISPTTTTTTNTTTVTNNTTSGFDLVVFDQLPPDQAQMPTIPALYIGCAPPLDGLTRKPSQDDDHRLFRIIQQHPDHPLMRYTVMDEVLLYQPGYLALPQDAVILATAENGPVLAELNRQGVRHIIASPRLLEYGQAWQWQHSLSFIVLMQNILQTPNPNPLTFGSPTMTKLATDSAGLSFKPGDVARLPAEFAADLYQGPTPLKPQTLGNTAILPPFEQTGLYAGGINTPAPYDQLAVNLLNEQETDTRPALVLPVASDSNATSSTNPNTSPTIGIAANQQNLVRSEKWYWFAFIALALVGIEWATYIKRVKI